MPVITCSQRTEEVSQFAEDRGVEQIFQHGSPPTVQVRMNRSA